MDPKSRHASCGLPYDLSNYQAGHACNASVKVGRPRDVEQLAELVAAFDRVKAVGVGHSWWQQQFCAGDDANAINVVMTELKDTLAVLSGNTGSAVHIDEDARTVRVAAGVTQRTLLQALAAYTSKRAPDGYTLPAFSWFIDQSIGGALATGTHGSSLRFGSLSSQMLSIKVLIANGTILDVTPASQPHLWRALQVHVGRLGVTIEATLRIVPNIAVRRNKQVISPDEFGALMSNLSERYTAALSANASQAALWAAVAEWDESELFYFAPGRKLWRVWFTRSDGGGDGGPQIQALDGADGGEGNGLPKGAYNQAVKKPVGAAPGMECCPEFWSGVYESMLSTNVVEAELPANQAYLSFSALENRLHGPLSMYDQYEAAVPLEKAGECVAALNRELYGAQQSWRGFRTPMLVRFVAGERAYLSPTNGGPRMYINVEDYVSFATGSPNLGVQRVMALLRSPTCAGRLHWGKAGWPEYAACFDGAREYPSTWCHMGCAVRQLDPRGKFAGQSDVWAWRATEREGGRAVGDFGSCCGGPGGAFDERKCVCAPRGGCAGR